MESFHDYKMVNNRSVVEQAHEIQCIVKELELLKCVLPDKFVAGCMIAKLPPSWRNFATTLKHKRQEISVENLIASLDVEEKARAKDTTEKGGEVQPTANMVQRYPQNKNKGKNKPVVNKPTKTTTFKKKKFNKAELECYACGKPVFQSSSWWIDSGRKGFFRPNGEWVTCFCSWHWHGGSEVYFGKDRATKERATCPYYKQESS
ncbi:unnamed protein product [Triticum turgidum subsp. durum]|uniref:Uncharacterized protein n=1 Tax=Triticum turgidum subsp. durum TaxID=4567 RepID=A0A9R0WV15_TRITD|nr:unnamed protein product [Triticum turgidum subsp. durum]